MATGDSDSIDGLLGRVVDCMATTVMLVDELGMITWAGGGSEAMSGFRPDELVGTNVLDHIDAAWDPVALDSIGAAMTRSGMQRPMRFRLWRKDGTAFLGEVQANSQWDDPILRGMVVHVRRCDERALLDEVVESLAAGGELDVTLLLLARVMGADTLEADGVVLLDPQRNGFGRAIAAAALPRPLLSGRSVRGTPWHDARGSGKPAWGSVDELPEPFRGAARERGHRSCWAWPVVRGDAVVACLVLWRDADDEQDHTCSMVLDNLARLTGLVLDQAQHTVRLHHEASHDRLTGLANRARFLDHLQVVVTDGPGPFVGVLYVDLDEFKPVNDRLGHAAGDEVLSTAGRRLEAAVRDADLVARLGGDEFAIACHGLEDTTTLEAIASRIATSMQEPIKTAGDRVVVGTSIGVAHATPGSCSVESLLAAADAALYAVKANGRGGWQLATSPVAR